jgi:uncharacterized protein YecA (UPF0149 family)
MDTRTGEVFARLQDAPRSAYPFVRAMRVPPTAEQLRNGKVGRNDPCPCGSGKKFKRCCLTPAAPRS